MEEIVPLVFHWTAFHENIEQEVHSYCVTGLGSTILIDPMLPSEGLNWFRQHATPQHMRRLTQAKTAAHHQ